MLTKEDISLLSRGLTFSPTIQPDSFQLFKGLNKFIKNLTLKRFFHIRSNKNQASMLDSSLSPILAPAESDLEDSTDSFISMYDCCIDSEDPATIDFNSKLLTQHL